MLLEKYRILEKENSGLKEKISEISMLQTELQHLKSVIAEKDEVVILYYLIQDY